MSRSGNPAPPSAEYVIGYLQGVADATARVVGVVAVEHGQDSPAIERIMIRIGELVGAIEGGAR